MEENDRERQDWYERPFLGVDGRPEESIPTDPYLYSHAPDCDCIFCQPGDPEEEIEEVTLPSTFHAEAEPMNWGTNPPEDQAPSPRTLLQSDRYSVMIEKWVPVQGVITFKVAEIGPFFHIQEAFAAACKELLVNLTIPPANLDELMWRCYWGAEITMSEKDCAYRQPDYAENNPLGRAYHRYHAHISIKRVAR